jgi:hypothetical protein
MDTRKRMHLILTITALRRSMEGLYAAPEVTNSSPPCTRFRKTSNQPRHYIYVPSLSPSNAALNLSSTRILRPRQRIRWRMALTPRRPTR